MYDKNVGIHKIKKFVLEKWVKNGYKSTLCNGNIAYTNETWMYSCFKGGIEITSHLTHANLVHFFPTEYISLYFINNS